MIKDLKYRKDVADRIMEGNRGKRKGKPWEAICRGIEGLDPKNACQLCRAAIGLVARDYDPKMLGEKSPEAMLEELVGEHYDEFMVAYRKEYDRIEKEMVAGVELPPRILKIDDTMVRVPSVAKPIHRLDVKLSPTEAEVMNRLKADLAVGRAPEKIIGDVGKEFVALGTERCIIVLAYLPDEHAKALLDYIAEEEKKRKVSADRREEIAEVSAELGKKLSRAEIEEQATVTGYDINAHVFTPIAVGVATGRTKFITDAVEEFFYIYSGRALPELCRIASLLFAEKHEEKIAKMTAFQSALIAWLKVTAAETRDPDEKRQLELAEAEVNRIIGELPGIREMAGLVRDAVISRNGGD